MPSLLPSGLTGPFDAISPITEMGAFEALWARHKTSFKAIADLSRKDVHAVLSQFVSAEESEEHAGRAISLLAAKGVREFGVRVKSEMNYPEKLLDAENPVELLYFVGNWELVFSPAVAIVGTRSPTPEGLARARSLSRSLVTEGYTVVSGLARGIDTAAHNAAIDAGGRTIAVIGTSLAASYPPENAELQAKIASEHLLISQVPVLRYSQQGPAGNRLFFPERNITMSAITKATIIVEAGETSGTLIQATAALKQGGRKLFILDNCFRDSKLTWPARFEKQGAIRVRAFSDILEVLGSAEEADQS